MWLVLPREKGSSAWVLPAKDKSLLAAYGRLSSQECAKQLSLVAPLGCTVRSCLHLCSWKGCCMAERLEILLRVWVLVLSAQREEHVLKVWVLRSVCGRDWGWELGGHRHENKCKTVRFRVVPCSGHSCVESGLHAQVLLSVPSLWHAASFDCFWIKTDGCVNTTVWWIKEWSSRIMWFGKMSDWCCP